MLQQLFLNVKQKCRFCHLRIKSELFFYIILHWLTDFLWLYFLSILSFKGGQFFGKKLQQVLFTICGVFLLFFGANFIYEAVKNIFLM